MDEQETRLAAATTDDSRYRLLVEAITDYAVYMLDPTGIVTSWNAGARRFKGYEADEIIGRHFSRFYTPQDRAAGAPQKALATARTEGRFETEGWRVRKDGSRFWTHVVIDPIRSPSGELIGYAKITRDLSERRAAEAALKRSEEQFRLLVQGVTDYAIYLLDKEGHVATWNAGAQRIKGYFPEEIVDQHFSRSIRRTSRRSGSRSAISRSQPRKAGSRRKAGGSARTEAASGRVSSSTRSVTSKAISSASPRSHAT